MDEIKYMAIYLDNSCEVHFNTEENSRIILSPCGTEFIYRVYDSHNTIQSTFKYRTAYPLSMFSSKLRTILTERNRFCDDRPFISPILLENLENSFWMSPDNLTEAEWDTKEMSLRDKNPIEIDYHNFVYIWKSACKNVDLKLHFNKKILSVKYPVKVPKSLNDEYEQKCDINSKYSKFKNKDQHFVSKHIFKYTWNEQEFTVNHLPQIWEELYFKMIQLVENLQSQAGFNSNIDSLVVKLPEAIQLSCQSSHLHKFDNIETISEPKIIYLNQTWYKLFYKNKSIEISCPVTQRELNPVQKLESSDLESTQDYLIADNLTGKYYTCFSLNRRNGDVDESKICVENIPSFKTYMQKTLSYSNILLKRIDSIKYISNYSSCYITKKFEQIEPNDLNQNKSNISTVSIENATNNISSTETTLGSGVKENSLRTLESMKLNIKNQFYIKDVGHFKYLRNNTILINFIDRVKLFVDENSIKKYLKSDLSKSFCSIYLPDNSEHELCLADSSSINGFFEKYLNFLDQWLNWLLDNKALSKENDHVSGNKDFESEFENVNFNSLQTHLSQLKYFNNSICQHPTDKTNETIKTDATHSETLISVSNLLRENSKFLQNITK